MEDIWDYIGEHFPSFGKLITGFILGVIFILFSFPEALIRLAQYTKWPVIGGMGDFSLSLLQHTFGSSLLAKSTAFTELWQILLIGLGVYAISITILSLRYLRFDFFLAGIFFLALGIASIHVVTWAILIAGYILLAIWIVLKWVWGIVTVIFKFIGYLLIGILHIFSAIFKAIWSLLLYEHIWVYAVALLGILLLYLIIKYFDEIKDYIVTLGVLGLI